MNQIQFCFLLCFSYIIVVKCSDYDKISDNNSVFKIFGEANAAKTQEEIGLKDVTILNHFGVKYTEPVESAIKDKNKGNVRARNDISDETEIIDGSGETPINSQRYSGFEGSGDLINERHPPAPPTSSELRAATLLPYSTEDMKNQDSSSKEQSYTTLNTEVMNESEFLEDTQKSGISDSNVSVFTTSEGSGVTISEGSGATFSEGSGVTIFEESGVTISEGSGVTISEGSGVTIFEGSGVTISEGSGIIDSEGSGIVDSEGSGIIDSEGSGRDDAMISGITVSEGSGTSDSIIHLLTVEMESGNEVVNEEGSGHSASVVISATLPMINSELSSSSLNIEASGISTTFSENMDSTILISEGSGVTFSNMEEIEGSAVTVLGYEGSGRVSIGDVYRPTAALEHHNEEADNDHLSLPTPSTSLLHELEVEETLTGTTTVEISGVDSATDNATTLENMKTTTDHYALSPFENTVNPDLEKEKRNDLENDRMNALSLDTSELDEIADINRRWKPHIFDCQKEEDDKGMLCQEWADGGLCVENRATMFLFCRKTCLCIGPKLHRK